MVVQVSLAQDACDPVMECMKGKIQEAVGIAAEDLQRMKGKVMKCARPLVQTISQ